jgi:hypothetical protein
MSLRGAQRRSNLDSQHERLLRFARNDIQSGAIERLCVRPVALFGKRKREFCANTSEMPLYVKGVTLMQSQQKIRGQKD